MNMKTDVTKEVADLLAEGAKAVTIGYLCIQGQGKRICQGCTTGCDQSIVLVQTA